ncbi:MAG: thymidine phosphorylase [Anaerolineales bacterium]|nr:thymidine phosphorylase [Anaerolineales bacterium]MCW5855891.1 thymidine phosphorylase [Anaerolineales bacterium]
MRATDIIIKKRDKQELTPEEIRFFIKGYTDGSIADYQVAAWAMAVLLNGMNAAETTELTLAMARSGETLDLSGVVDLALDKHSTGGVGDKTTLVVEPVLAACGCRVGKMSGRGLGFSGGTLDKMESIPGYRTDLSREEFLQQLKDVGLVLTGQTGDLAPADGKLYALRDVSGTVDSPALIAASIMSKKIAAGAQRIVLDVKVGLGAFMTNLDDARALAEMMVAIGAQAGRKTVALLSDMNQPLGHAVGNALEVKEALDTLRGGGPADFREHALEVAAHLLVLAGVESDLPAARQRAAASLADGSALERFRTLVAAQGGDASYVDDPDKLPSAALIEEVPAPRSGYLQTIHAREVGESAVELGAGRAQKGEPIDHSVGFVIHHKVGDQVQAGQPLFSVHAGDAAKLAAAKARVLAAHHWSDAPVEPLPLFYGTIE